MKKYAAALVSAVWVVAAAQAAPVKYEIDPEHTFPSIETDHLGGLSIWRGKFTKTSGQVMLDREAGTGSVDILIDASSIDFGHAELEQHVRDEEILNVAKYPQVTYKGKLTQFVDGAPQQVEGELTLKGVTRPVTLKITQFLCKPHPFAKKEACGADATATINRSDFGVDYGKDIGFKQDVKLLISIEAIRADSPTPAG
jgi:polyisoprenoid-binding protein YceI